MITYISKGNIFDSKMQTLVNPVNCVGVMGKGLALEFKKRYPDMFLEYVGACRDGRLKIGNVTFHDLLNESTGVVECKIICFPTKQHWNDTSRYEIIECGLRLIASLYEGDWQESPYTPRSLAIPALGCGLGGLSWSIVKKLIQKRLGNIDIPIEVYEPKDWE